MDYNEQINDILSDLLNEMPDIVIKVEKVNKV